MVHLFGSAFGTVVKDENQIFNPQLHMFCTWFGGQHMICCLGLK